MNAMTKTARQVVAEEIDRQIAEMERISCRDMERECRLKEWGLWARRHDSRLGYSTLPAFRAKGWGEPTLEEYIERISDDEAFPIDTAIASLPERHKEVIVAIYMYCIPWLKLPLIMGMGRRQIEFYQGQAVGIIWTKLGSWK